MSVDHTFILDLERERATYNELAGPAHNFLHRDENLELCMSAVVLGELAEAYGGVDHPVLWRIQRAHRVLSIDGDVAAIYASIVHAIQDPRAPMRGTDAWIAATAIRHGVPLLTADVAHFQRVPNLQVLAYR